MNYEGFATVRKNAREFFRSSKPLVRAFPLEFLSALRAGQYRARHEQVGGIGRRFRRCAAGALEGTDAEGPEGAPGGHWHLRPGKDLELLFESLHRAAA